MMELPAYRVRRYLEASGDQLEEAAQKKLEPIALSCFLNTAACDLKMQLWQEAVDSCDEVTPVCFARVHG